MEEKKQIKKKKRRKKRYALRLLIFIILLTGLYYFMTSSWFDISAIETKGNEYYDGETVIKMSTLKQGTNIFRLERSRVEGLLLKDPYIKEAKIKRKLPHTAVIHIVERTEDAAFPYGEAYILISLDKMVLRRVDEEPKVPILMGMTLEQMTPGTELSVAETTVLDNTMILLDAMREEDLYFKKIDISKVVVRAYIYDRLICEGKPENILKAVKNGNLQLVLKDLVDRGIDKGTIHLGSSEYCAFSPEIE